VPLSLPLVVGWWLSLSRRADSRPSVPRGAHETISGSGRKGPETEAAYDPPEPKTGLVMLAIILKAIYRQFITATLPGIRLGTRR
jgi:hypothetical protein